jgi:TIR domain
VRWFAAKLRRPGVEVWMDDELKLARCWNDEIRERIAACDLFLPLLSRATQMGDAKRFFCREWRLAHAARRRFLPVRLEDCRLPASLPKSLAAAIESHQREDLFPSYEEGLCRILRLMHEEKRSAVFEETFSCVGPDNTGWQLGGWKLEADSRGENSHSIHAAIRLDPMRLLPQAASQIASVDIDLPARALLLRYRRRLRLSAPVGGEAVFRVLVDGEVVDTASQAYPTEDQWTTRSVPVPDRGARRATLELTVTVSGGMNYFPAAEARIDDLRIA